VLVKSDIDVQQTGLSSLRPEIQDQLHTIVEKTIKEY